MLYLKIEIGRICNEGQLIYLMWALVRMRTVMLTNNIHFLGVPMMLFMHP